MIDRVYPRHLRLTKPGEYAAVFNQGKRGGDQQFNIICRPNGMPYPRLGMVIARKFLRRAVDRNRIKRQIRESFRNNKQALPAIDIVVQLREDIRNVSNHLLRLRLSQAWEQVAKLCAR